MRDKMCYKKGLNVTEQLTGESNSIIRNVNDIIYIPELHKTTLTLLFSEDARKQQKFLKIFTH